MLYIFIEELAQKIDLCYYDIGDIMSFYTNLINYKEKTFSLHKHNLYEIIIYLRGTGLFYTPDQKIPVKSGSIIVVPPGVMHDTTPYDDLQSIRLSGKEMNLFFNFSTLITLTDNKKQEGALLAKMIYDNRYGNSEYFSALCSAYMRFISQNLTMQNHIDSAVGDIVREITDNFHECDINLNTILNKSGYAEDYIRAQFKRIIGKTPTSFLTDIRIKHACFLIDTYQNARPLSEIALRCGYTDYVYFSRKFKSVMGISPQKYKKL